MNSKRIVLSLLILFTFQVSSMAQDKWKSKFDSSIEPERRKWAVSMDLLAVLKTPIHEALTPNFNITKYNLEKKTALGLGILLDQNTSTTDNWEYNSLQTGVFIGKEFQKQHGYFMLSYGPSIGGIHHKVRTYETSQQSSDYMSNDSDTYAISSSFSLGLRFFLNSRISLSTSSSFNISYSWTDKKEVTTLSNGLIKNESNTSSTTFANSLSGFSSILLGFHF